MDLCLADGRRQLAPRRPRSRSSRGASPSVCSTVVRREGERRIGVMSFPPRIACDYSRSLGKKEGRKEEAKTPCSRVIHERGRARESGEAFPASFLPRSFLPSSLCFDPWPDRISSQQRVRSDTIHRGHSFVLSSVRPLLVFTD